MRVALVVLAVMLVARSVRAQPLDAAGQAGALRERGNQAMLDMRYVDALALYEESRKLAPDQVGVLYSLARAHQLLGEFPEALASLEEFEHRASPEQRALVGQLARLFAELRSRVSTLHLTCNQPGARVLVNDVVVGTTPLPADRRLKAGAARLQVELDGFFPEVRELVLPSQGALELSIELKPRSTSALLLVSTRPENAEVFVDEQRIGTSSPRAEWVVSAGSHRVSARREGYEEASVPVQLPAGESRELTVALTPTRPVYKRWWFWVSTGVVLAGGAALTAALLIERDADHGSLGQGTAPLLVEF
jgi:tetratricopeptide (TPR) repeat protein